MKKILKDISTGKLLLCTVLAVFLYAICSINYNAFDIPAAKINDVFLRLSAPVKPVPAELDEFVILAIDSDSIDFSNMRWPWRRGFTAEILEQLALGAPKTVFFDFVLTGRSDAEEDARLQKALTKLGNVFIASFIDDSGLLILPHPIFTEAAYGTGFVNNPFDLDNIIRRSRMVSLSKLSVDERVGDYSGMVKLFALYNGFSSDALLLDAKEKTIDSKTPIVGSFPIKLNADRTMSVNFSFTPDKFKVVPAWKVFKKQIDPSVFKDKIVLVGATAELTHDMYRTPLGIMPGIYVKGYELATMLSQDFVSRLSPQLEYLILTVLLFVIALFSYRFILSRGFFVFLSAMLVYYFFYLALTYNNIYTDGFAPLFMGAMIYIGANFYKQVRLRHDINKLQLLAVTDSLTGLYVRRYFQLRLQYEWSHARKTRVPFSLLMLDVDFFKKINDTYGHLCGDMVLAKVSAIIQECCRKVDIVCRYGGEEFAIVLSQTDNDGAIFLAEKIRSSIENASFVYEGQDVKVTISCGSTTYGKHPADAPEELIAQADDCLYKAKEGGRNKVVSC